MDNIYNFILNLVVTNGVIIAVATFVLGQIIKTISDKYSKYIPLVGGICGVILGVLLPNVFPDADYVTRAIYGLALGWAATGGYETVKQLTKKEG